MRLLKNLSNCYRHVKDELYVLLGAILLVTFLSGTIVYEAERSASRSDLPRTPTACGGAWSL